MRSRTNRHADIHRDTHKETRVTTIHFASSTTHAKCNKTRATAIGRAHTSFTPLRHSVVTACIFSHCSVYWFSQPRFHFSHQLTTGLTINMTECPDYVPGHFKKSINSSPQFLTYLFHEYHETGGREVRTTPKVVEITRRQNTIRYDTIR